MLHWYMCEYGQKGWAKLSQGDCSKRGESGAGTHASKDKFHVHMYIPFGASFNSSLRCSTADSVAPPPCLATPTKEARTACTQSVSTNLTVEQSGTRNRL